MGDERGFKYFLSVFTVEAMGTGKFWEGNSDALKQNHVTKEEMLVAWKCIKFWGLTRCILRRCGKPEKNLLTEIFEALLATGEKYWNTEGCNLSLFKKGCKDK